MNEAITAVKIEEVSPVKKKLVFDISWVNVKKELDAVYRDMGRKAKVKGFRQGKIPRNILESLYKDNVEVETISNIVNKYYWDAVKEKGILTVSQPDIEQKGIEEEKNFMFSATVEVEPEIEPDDYIGLELEKEEKEVTESDVEEKLQQIRDMFATMEEVLEERETEAGDFTVIDFEGTIDGESLKELTTENYLLEIGSGMFVPGFEEQLIGMRKDETKRIQVTFPKEYGSERVAGKQVDFKVTLKSIKEKKLPELDENFIKNFDKYETLEDLRNDIKKSLEEENKAQSDLAFHNLIITKLLEKNEFEAPPSFIERQIQYMIADTRQRLASKGLDRKRTEELSNKYREIYKEEATKIVKSVLLMKSIAAKESIDVTENEIDDKIQEMARRRGQDFNVLKKSLEENDMIQDVRNEILNIKATDFVKDKAVIRQVKKD